MEDNNCYHCKFCNSTTKSIKAHLSHLRFHRHLSKFIVCGLGRCKSSFTTESALRYHIIRNHKVYVAQSKRSIFKLSDQNCHSAKYHCPISSCQQKVFYHKDFVKHLKEHLNNGLSVPCPSSDCKKTFNSYHALTGHVSKKHRGSHQGVAILAPVTEPVQPQPISEDQFDNLDVTIGQGQDLLEEVRDTPQEDCTIALAQFFQKLEYKHMVPGSVTQVVAKEIKDLLMDCERCFINKLALNLENQEVSQDVVSEVLSSMSTGHTALEASHILRSVYMRKLFYKNHFCFVEPIAIPLENGSFFYLIPPDKTLIAAFQNKSWTFCVKPPPFSEDGCIRDFFDGQSYKTNPFFRENPDAVPIILYQDGFQVVCAIGPAKNLKHKFIGVYMAFGNLPCDIRFKKDSIQLVALIRDCDFNHTEVFGRVVEELKKLEQGVEVPGIGLVKAGMAFIAGDNLGSHGLGGFAENFSRSHHFCRHCHLTREQYYRPGGEVRQFQKRTEESYQRAVQNVKINKDGTVKPCEGIKFDSEFNKLDGFHVVSGLPFCIGHDLMEGIIAHDLKLYIQRFVELGWFDDKKLNDLIINFPYSEEDLKDRPVPIKDMKKKRLAGGAWQLWQTLRLFPLIIKDHIKDPNDKGWLNLLLLKQIAEMAIAPEIHESFLGEFQESAQLYL